MLLVLAGVAYSAWLLAYVLPVGLSLVHAYVSELAAGDQPYRLLFRTTDRIAGAAMVAAAVLLAVRAPRRPACFFALGGLFLFGLSVVVDASSSLDCASAASEACRIKEDRGAVSAADTLHTVSSVVTNFGMLAAVLGAQRFVTGTARALLFAAAAVIAATGLAIVWLDTLGPGHYAGLVLQVQLVAAAAVLITAGVRLAVRKCGPPASPAAPAGSSARRR
ncbi:hypothetical protein GCM10009754_48760 [Amycolatopsis minnesotensis]|uniref:DUF998 domain-containing protein n=1 Tax=Amycolatopsis minnesotensis TaxID=337894 RepID=A0ABP5CWB6_9PSEU